MKSHCQIRPFRGMYFSSLLYLMLLSVFSIPQANAASSCEDYATTPPFLTKSVKPNVLFMLDNSGSMKEPAYRTGGSDGLNNNCSRAAGIGYDSTTDYYGLFESDKTYSYNDSIPIDESSFNGTPYTVAVDTSVKGAFVQTTCTTSLGNNCWSGNFLNWMTTRKMDSARKVLVGGKTESRAGYDYLANGSTTWKLVGNNERSDRSFCRAYSSSETTSPYPNNTKFLIHSPADAGKVKTKYDPYAKLQPVGASNFIYDKGNHIIGEFGTITNLTHITKHVTLQGTYAAPPIIVAKPPSYNGTDPSVIRIENITGTGFDVQIQEWDYKDGAHTTESVSYVALVAGQHTLAGASGDIKIVAGSANVNTNLSLTTINLPGLSTPPVIIASVTSKNDATPVTTRITNITSNSFTPVLQHEEQYAFFQSEKVDYIAMEPGTTSGPLVIQAGKDSGFDENFKSLNFTNLSATAFVADMQTINGDDPATLRYKNFSGNSVDIRVEEEKSYDTEIAHEDESVGYIAFAPASYNIAVIVNTEPTGLVQNIEDKVRTGISFYRYQQDGDIYNNEYAHGGTLKLNIPKNPFVKASTNTGGYYTLNTHVKATTADIIDSIEHYPLVWGTTPLAENLWEVGNYFRQVTPWYTDKPYIPNAAKQETTFETNDTWDPYSYLVEGQWEKIRCAKSFVILFTDGVPYRDDYIPAEVVGYDPDTKTKDCRSTGNTSNKCQDNLDDVAKYMNWDYDKNSTPPAPHSRDLRPENVSGDADLKGNQNLDIFTVAFGSKDPPQILKDTADNADGKWYGAEDGATLGTALTSAITDILSKTSAGSSLSVLSERATTGSMINQALFFPNKTFNNSYDVAWTGSINAYWFYNSKKVSNIRENTVDPNGDYALDIFDDKVLDFRIDKEGNLKIDFYKTIQDGTGNDGARDPAGLDGTHQNIDEVPTIFEVGEKLKDRKVDADPSQTNTRRIVYGINESGTMEDEFVQSKYSSFDDLFNLIDADIPQCLGTADSNKNVDSTSLTNKQVAANNLISYIRGAADDFSSQTNISESCRSRKVDSNGDLWKLGDIIYSTPRVVDYATGSDEFSLLYTGANDGMLHAFKLGKLRKDQAKTNQAVALCDSNNGDCTHTEIGDEAWTFIPKNAMPYLKYLADPNYKHIYTVDLPPYIIQAGDKQILIGGMRFGGATGCTYTQGNKTYWCGDTDRDGVIDLDSDGVPVQAVPPGATPATINSSNLGLSSYFALDITDPYNPKFLWEFSDPSMGYSYSGPAFITRKVGNTVKKYVLLLSGPLSNKGGTSSGQDLKTYILELDPDDFTLTKTYKIDGRGEPGFVKESAISNLDSAFGGRLFTDGIDSDKDGSTDAVFFGVNWLASTDWKGNVFLVAPTDDDPVDSNGDIMWEIGSVFNSGQTPITAKIDHGMCYGHHYIYFGSGRWFYKLDTPGKNALDKNSLWGIQIDQCIAALADGDPQTKCTGTLNGSHNGQIGNDHCVTPGGLLKTTNDISWQYTDMEPRSGDYFMERNITDPTITSNLAIFTTMQPSSDLCDFGGRTRLQAFNCRTGHNIFEGCSDASSALPPGALLLQLSGGNIEDTELNEDNFKDSKGKISTKWFTGVPPESGTPFVPYAGALTGEIILWLER